MLRRNGVQTQIGGADTHTALAPDATRDTQHLQFAVMIQPIAGLDLDRGDARGFQPSRRAMAETNSSSSDASRVALTEETMPPPARAISS